MTMSIAIVDDDESLCRSLSRLLRHAGFQATAFLSAEEFLASPVQRRFGCLLLDVQLGGMSGPELHRRLLESGDRTPVIYITAQDNPEAAAEARRIGCAGFFRKSDPGIQIVDTLRKLGAA
jgi:FixJ family two-component response regulator